MSHVVSIKIELKDLEAVKAACKDLGLTFKENQKKIRWFGKWVGDYSAEDAAYKLGIKTSQYGTCDHAIEVPNSQYDIGLLKNPATGGYRIYFDFFGDNGRLLQDAIGKNGEKFVQYYGASLYAREMQKKGYTVQRSISASGELKVKAVCYA